MENRSGRLWYRGLKGLENFSHYLLEKATIHIDMMLILSAESTKVDGNKSCTLETG